MHLEITFRIYIFLNLEYSKGLRFFYWCYEYIQVLVQWMEMNIFDSRSNSQEEKNEQQKLMKHSTYKYKLKS